MKKSVRILSSVVLVCLLCTMLSGCQALEDARAAQGFWVDEGQRFRLGDSEYIRLPESEALELLYVEYDDEVSDIYVTTEDVPVLLASGYGVAFTPSSNGRLCVPASEYEDRWSEMSTGIFCRSEYYQTLVQQLGKGFEPVGYCCVYWEWDDELYTYKERLYRLTAEQTAAMDVMLESERTYLPDMAEPSYDYSIDLNFCSEDMMLQKFAVELCCADNSYFLLGEDFDQEWVIQVPMQYAEIANALLKPVREDYESYEYDYDDYDEDYDESLDFVV
ncbi:MAG: hypothetical protein IKU56_01190 [Clostridia bacterium]|nr:hypothetical protein [Clostridia bacterium]